MNNPKRTCLAKFPMVTAQPSAACTGSSEMPWSDVLWLMRAPYFLAVPLVALSVIALLLLGAFGGRGDLQRYSIVIAAVRLTGLSSPFWLGGLR